MFEKMRDAGLADRVIGRAVPVPDHMGDHRRPVIRDDDDLEAVRELAMRDAGAAPLLALRQGRGQVRPWGGDWMRRRLQNAWSRHGRRMRKTRECLENRLQSRRGTKSSHQCGNCRLKVKGPSAVIRREACRCRV